MNSPEYTGKPNDAALRECRADLKKVKDTVIDYISSNWDRRHLESLRTHVGKARCSLGAGGLERPAKILDSCSIFVMSLEGSPDWRKLDAFADVISSIDYYLGTFSDDGVENLNILEVAEDATKKLVPSLGTESGDSTSKDSNSIISYKKQLREWKSLPLFKRLRTKKPD